MRRSRRMIMGEAGGALGGDRLVTAFRGFTG